jgi:hypothetical protein
VDEIVEVGDIDSDHVVTPGIFVDRIVKVPEGGLGSPQRSRELLLKVAQLDLVRKIVFR